ncbi:MAG: EAL domain-containing protein [Myxococcota bacterium]
MVSFEKTQAEASPSPDPAAFFPTAEATAFHCVMITNAEGRVLKVNESWKTMMGCSRYQAVGDSVDRWIAWPSEPTDVRSQVFDTTAQGGAWTGRLWLRSDGRVNRAHGVSAAILPLRRQRDGRLRMVWIWKDDHSEERPRAQAPIVDLGELSRQDGLTGIPNRSHFVEQLALAHRRADIDAHWRCGVMVMDLDRFRLINDAFGHEEADRILIQIAMRLTQGLGSSACLARLAGDEFAVLLEAPPHSDLEAQARALLARLDQPFDIKGYPLKVCASAGFADYQLGTSPSSLLRRAESAMLRAKRRGGGCLTIFEPRMDFQAWSRLRQEQSLRAAVSTGQIATWFQPQVVLATGEIVGFEALARWPEARGRHPGEFVPMAEQIGLIRPLAKRVLTEALEFAVAVSDLRISLNLSAIQLDHPETFADLESGCHRYQVAPSRVELELTESAAMEDSRRARTLCEGLDRSGFELAIDDFGTGYSSLALLHQLPARRLKVDRRFVAGLGRDEGSLAILRSILGLARSMNMETVAEGVETIEQLRILQREGCELGQGFLFAPALPASEARGTLGRRFSV